MQAHFSYFTFVINFSRPFTLVCSYEGFIVTTTVWQFTCVISKNFRWFFIIHYYICHFPVARSDSSIFACTPYIPMASGSRCPSFGKFK